jgi:hypothetical protein
MINNDTMYGLYKEALSDKGRAILASCVTTQVEEDLIAELLNTIKIFHPEHINVKSVLEFTNTDLKALRMSKQNFTFITSYINTINTMKANKIKSREASKLLINKTEFSFILTTFNRLLWKAMIDKAYVFKDSMIGSIYVVCRENAICKPKMKWKESKANKQAILDKGGIARIELEARTAEYNNEDYKGEEWIERHDPFNLIIKWRRSSYANLKLPTIKDFNMKLCRTGASNGVVNFLKDERDNNKLEDLLIKYHKRT